jgi:hypothetical protein
VIENSLDGLDSQQEELDLLLSRGEDLPVDVNGYSQLYRYLGASNARLPAHFREQVMKRILQKKIERARTFAMMQSGLIGTLSLIAGVGLVIFSARFLGSQDLPRISAEVLKIFVLPGLAASVLLLLLMLDGILIHYPSGVRQP